MHYREQIMMETHTECTYHTRTQRFIFMTPQLAQNTQPNIPQNIVLLSSIEKKTLKFNLPIFIESFRKSKSLLKMQLLSVSAAANSYLAQRFRSLCSRFWVAFKMADCTIYYAHAWVWRHSSRNYTCENLLGFCLAWRVSPSFAKSKRRILKPKF